MPQERILITVKTYPTLSQKYGETVCTAGLRPDGSWVRLYPIPFRRLEDLDRYRKFDWLETTLVPSRSDVRPETFHPVDWHEFKTVGFMDTKDRWRERRDMVLGKAKVYDRLDELMVAAKANTMSLAVFKPKRIISFQWEDDEPEWDPRRVDLMRSAADQSELFPEDDWRKTFNLIPKLPYSFFYHFEDITGRRSTLKILDWECGQLYWNCSKKFGVSRTDALEKVRQKYIEDLGSKDIHFFLGTTKQFHGFSPNPWLIIGVFAPPFDDQMELGL